LPRIDIADFYCQAAREHLQFDWMVCFDADERVTGDLRGYMELTHSSDYDGVRVQLFDAYMSPGDQAPYQADCELLNERSKVSSASESEVIIMRVFPPVKAEARS
jgi:hypothetical protein